MPTPRASRDRGVSCRQALIIGVIVFVGCTKSLPVAPSELAEGIVVYEHANYLGTSAHITQDIKDLKDVLGPCEETVYLTNGGTRTDRHWNDCISSVRVAAGWRATLYYHDDFKGDRLEVSEDVPNLQLAAGDCDKGGVNDCVTSIRVYKP